MSAQRTGTISGTVRDATGAVLPGVEVTITDVETGITRGAITGDEGRYRAPELAVGSYEIRAQLAGFRATVRRGVELTVGQEAVVDMALEVGEIAEEVVVTGDAPLVNTTDAALSSLIDQKQVHDLPLNSRNLTQLSLLTPGVTRAVTSVPGGVSGGGQAEVKVSMSGARIHMTGFLLDGTDITDSSRSLGPGGAAGALFGVETVREVQVITNNFSAEYSRFAGGVITMVTKSGTNSFHSSIFEFLRNDNLDARNFFDIGNPPEFKRHQFGATLGGPIRKDRTFFFGSYEGFRQGLGLSLFALTPTAAARQGLLPGGRTVEVNPAVKPFLNLLYPLPNGRDLGQGTGEYFVAKTDATNENFFTARIDHSFSKSDTFFGRYTSSKGTRTLQSSMPATGSVSDNGSWYVTLEEKHIVSPNVINTARVGFQRTRLFELPTPDSFSPEVAIGLIPGEPTGLISPGSGITNAGRANVGQLITNSFSYSDDLFMTRGNHGLKMGVNVTRFQNNDFVTGFFGGSYTFAGLESFLLGRPTNWRGTLPGSSARRGFRQSVVGGYIQDDFKARANFTMNLGLRYETYTGPDEVNGLIANLRNPLKDANTTVGSPFFKNPSRKNFAPRIGFAWDPWGNGKTSIRSSFGLFNDTILFYQYANQARRQPPFITTVLVNSPPFPRPVPGGAENRAVVSAEFEPHQPYMMQWNLTLQREVFSKTALTVSYLGSRGVHLQGEHQVNVAVPQVLSDGRKFFAPGLSRRNLNWAEIRLFASALTKNDPAVLR